MNPDIDLRLKSVEKALTDVIARAVPEDEQLARDQVNLVVGHLREIAAHWKYALRYELGSMDALRQLADDVAAHATTETRRTLTAACAAVDVVDREDFDRVQEAQRNLGAALDRVISADHVTDPMPQPLLDAVLEYYAGAGRRERVWHQGSGLDPDAASLPSRDSLFERRRS